MQGLYNAASSMLVNQVRLENISNNLSNLNTPGFKRSEVVSSSFPEVLFHRLERNSGRGSSLSPIGTIAQNIALEETFHVHTGGPLRSTGRSLDLALQGPGFFVVQTPEGLRYTRDGHFGLNGQGTLVNSQGYPVLGEMGTITLTDDPVIDRLGNIYDNNDYVERLRVVELAADDLLWKDGYNLFQVGEGVQPLPAEQGAVVQGYLEESNADLAREMTALIKVRRSYEAAQKISQAYDRLLSRAANELGSLR